MTDAGGHGRLHGVDVSLVESFTIAAWDLAALETIGSAVAELVEEDAIRILDLVCLTRGIDDVQASVFELDDVESLRALNDVDGEVGGLLSSNDIELASLAVEPGSAAILIVVEDRWAERLSTAARSAGGRVLGGQRISPTLVDDALNKPRATARRSAGTVTEEEPGHAEGR
ncbi:MAG: hypothetical protein ACJ72A_10735 [Nocardioidaceae bacterium]